MSKCMMTVPTSPCVSSGKIWSSFNPKRPFMTVAGFRGSKAQKIRWLTGSSVPRVIFACTRTSMPSTISSFADSASALSSSLHLACAVRSKSTRQSFTSGSEGACSSSSFSPVRSRLSPMWGVCASSDPVARPRRRSAVPKRLAVGLEEQAGGSATSTRRPLEATYCRRPPARSTAWCTPRPSSSEWCSSNATGRSWGAEQVLNWWSRSMFMSSCALVGGASSSAWPPLG
mmetsp:Transcript_71062/g.206053  ORF Transcript_71062/g.206053 Transcript_71062/m.206053 type:complete len:230 (+) Transcript_71062:1489-2178(+)